MIDSIWMCSQQIEMFSILLIGYSWEEEGISYCLLSFFCLEKVDRLQSSVCGLSFSVFLGSGLASAVSCVQHYMTFHLEVCVNSRDTAEYSWRRDEWSFRRYTNTIHATICRQYYWEQYIGPLLSEIPIILLLLVLLDFRIFLFYYLS